MKSDRLMSIILLLTEKKMMSAPALADLYQVSTRTIYRDVQTLSMAGIPIYTTTGKNGGIGILDSYKIDKQLLNLNDITSLLIGLDSIHEVMPPKALNTVTDKVKGLLDRENKEDVERRIQQVKIIHIKQKSLMSIKIREDIQAAIQQQKLLKIVYRDREGKGTERMIEPYRVLYKGNTWYVQGYCLSRHGFRTFQLNRIARVERMDTAFVPRKIPIEELNGFSFWDKDICTAKLRITDRIKDRVVSLYGEGCIISKDNDDWIVQIPIPLNSWGLYHLLGFGKECQCLAPDALKEALKSILKRMLDYY